MVLLKWGICATGQISWDFVSALSMRDAAKHRIVAVAARDVNRAKEFASKFGIEKAYSNYLDLANDADIDIVYVGTRNETHFELGKKYLNAGKHVMCETSITSSTAEMRELAALAKEKGKFLMEGIWSRCFPLYKTIREIIDSGELGTVRSVEARFTYDSPSLGADNEERLMNMEFGGGALRDLGMYNLQLVDWVFREKPTKVHAVGRILKNGVDVSSSITLQYSEGRFAVLTVGILGSLDISATLFGDKADLLIASPFHATTKLTVRNHNGQTRTIESDPLPSPRYETHYVNSAGFAYEADHIYECIVEKKLTESPLVPLDLSVWIQEVFDESVKQILA